MKWAGGKGQLLPELLRHLPKTIATYHEPFVGGAALFFELVAQGRIRHAILSDANSALIDVYEAVRDDVEAVIGCLREHKHDRDHYYTVRALRPKDLTPTERAARVIFLNRTCYNGLYRENRSGDFNVPFGRHSNPTICDASNLCAAARALQIAEIVRAPYHATLMRARAGDLVYFDPPYYPVSPTSNFTSYTNAPFGEREQIALRDTFAVLGRAGVSALLSNSDTPFIRELYEGFPMSRVFARRAVNSKAGGRGKIAELLVRTYALPGDAP